jgi:membrane protein
MSMSALTRQHRRRRLRALAGLAEWKGFPRRGEFSARRYAAEVVDAFNRHDLLTSASAISFQIFSAIVPFMLFALSLLGFLNMADTWRDSIAPHIRPNVSPPAFTVIDDTVKHVLASRQTFWLTAGLVLTIWQVSGAVRAVMGALNRIHGVRPDRPWGRRMLVSFGLALVLGVAYLGAIAVVAAGPLAYGRVGQPAATLLLITRWGLAGALMLLAVALILRYGPAKRLPITWVSLGTLSVIGSWIVTSIGFVAYIRLVASYQSVYGNLATVVVLGAYVYLSAVAFLAGAEVDAIVRSEVERS